MLSRRAFARTAELGQLYDANNDVLLPGSIIKLDKKIPKKTVSSNSNEFVEHNFLYAYNTDDQYKHLDIDTSLRLSLYAGLIEVGGSGKYLLNTKSNKKSIKGSFYYKLVKHDDELLLENIPFDSFDFNILQKGFCKDATHLIVRRQYGADLFFTFESTNGNKELLKQIETRMEASVNKVGLSGGIQDENFFFKGTDDIHVSFYGDAKPPSKYKGTIESVLECLTEIDEITKNPNQMIWDLYPISILKKTFEDKIKLNNLNLNLELTSSYDMILDETRSNILFHDWDILLENKKEFENLHKIINKNDETHLRLITEKIRILQHEVSKEYKHRIINQIKYLKKSNNNDNDNNDNDNNDNNSNDLDNLDHNLENENNFKTNSLFSLSDYKDIYDNNHEIEYQKPSQDSYGVNNEGVIIKETDIEIEIEQNSPKKNNVIFKEKIEESDSSEKSAGSLHDKKDERSLSDNDSTNFKKALAEQIINNINRLNDKILKYLRENKDILPKIESSINSTKDEQNSSIILRPNQIKFLEGISHVFLTKNYCVTAIEHEQYINYIRKNKPIRLDHKYYYFCNFDPDFKYKSNMVRYIRLIQFDTNKDPKDRWTHIRSIKIYDIDGNEICLQNKYIKLKYSSVSEEWSTGNLLDDDNSSYFHTSNGLFEWIEIDLASNLYISKVIVKNRVDSSNPNNNPERIIGHELQAFAENTLLGNKILVASSKIIKKDYVYEFEFTDYNGIISCSKGYHESNFEHKQLLPNSNIYMFWNNKIIGKFKNTVVWYKNSELSNIPTQLFNNKFMTKLCMSCPHDTSQKNNEFRNWICFQCNSITKITNLDNIWCMVCDECNILVKLEDCFFNCNCFNHGKEPFPFDKEFDVDSIKPKYMGGCYIIHDANEYYNKTIEYDSIDICNEFVKFDKYNKKNFIEYNFIKNNYEIEHQSTQYISPFMLYIQKNERTEYFILINLKENNYLNLDEKFLFNNNDNKYNHHEDFNCTIDMESNREDEYYEKCEKARQDYILMKQDISNKFKLISYSLLIQKENDIISLKKLEPTSYHLKMILIYLMKIFKSKVLSNNQLRKSGKWINLDNSLDLSIEFSDKSICECYINGIKADLTMLSPFTCVARYIKSHYGINSIFPNENIICFISIDSTLQTLYYFEFEKKNYYNYLDIFCCLNISNRKYNNGKFYKLQKEKLS